MGGGGSGGGAKAPKELLLHAGDPGSTHSPRESREQSRRQKGRKESQWRARKWPCRATKWSLPSGAFVHLPARLYLHIKRVGRPLGGGTRVSNGATTMAGTLVPLVSLRLAAPKSVLRY